MYSIKQFKKVYNEVSPVSLVSQILPPHSPNGKHFSEFLILPVLYANNGHIKKYILIPLPF